MLRNPRGSFLILSTGQYVYAESFLGKPPGWGENVERQIVASGKFELIYSSTGARIYVLRPAKEETSGTGRPRFR
jgi:hypothetical protein